MEIYITTNDCKIQNNYGLLPSLQELTTIKDNLFKIEQYIIEKNINTVEYNKRKIEEINNYNTKKEIKIKKSKEGYIYIIKNKTYFKIGLTINLEKRTKKYISENPSEIILIHSYYNNDIFLEEKRLHKLFENKRFRGEWFKLTKKDILYIKNL